VYYEKWLREQLLKNPELFPDEDITEEQRKTITEDPEPFVKYLNLVLQKYGFKQPDEDLQKMVRESLQLVFGPVAKAEAQILNRFLKTILRICCFCQNKASIVMWSHYASNHRGICIEYDTQEFIPSDSVANDLHPVIYKQLVFDAASYTSFFSEGVERNPLMTTIAACHKSREWSYEEEWRLIFPSRINDS
jgi:hypothetical protein